MTTNLFVAGFRFRVQLPNVLLELLIQLGVLIRLFDEHCDGGAFVARDQAQMLASRRENVRKVLIRTYSRNVTVDVDWRNVC